MRVAARDRLANFTDQEVEYLNTLQPAPQ